MLPVKKAYGYVTRMKEDQIQVLVFRHPIPEAGIQIPKGTVQLEEDTKGAVIREIEEETGLRDVHVEQLLAEDFWENDDGALHNRFFFRISVSNAPDEWDYNPAGGGEEDGLTFHFFWISSSNEVELIRGHGDYLSLVFN